MATTITIKADTKQATADVKKLADAVGGIGDAATDSGRETVREMGRVEGSLESAGREAAEAGKAVDGIADPAAINSLSDLAKKVDSAAQAADRLNDQSRKVKNPLDELAEKNKYVGEVTQRSADAMFDFVKSLGSGGLGGAAQTVLPKLSGLAGFLSGPWGAALTFGLGIAATMATELLSMSDASDEATGSIEDQAEAQRKLNEEAASYVDKLKQRIAAELSLRKQIAEGADETVEKMREELLVQNLAIQSLQNERDAAKELADQIKDLETKDASLAAQEVGALSPDRLSLSKQIAELQQRQKDQNIDLSRSEKSLADAIKERETMVRNLGLAQDSQARRRQREHQREMQEAEEKRRADEAQAKAAAEQKKQQEAATKKAAEEKQKTPAAAEKKPAIPAPKTPAATPFNPDLAREQLIGGGSSLQEQVNQSIDALFRSRLKARYEQLMNDRGEGVTQADISKQLQKERRGILAGTRADVMSGNVPIGEMQAAQQQAAEATLQAAQANGRLSQQTVDVAGRNIEETLKLTNDLSQLSQVVIGLQRKLNSAEQAGNRRRAQMGGGRG